MFADLERWLAEITGFAAVSLQPNAGSQGEYAGLLVIRAYHESRGDAHRNVCLIPVSAHGTNPASAVMAGCGWWWSPATPRATSTSPTCAPRRSTRRPRRADGHLPLDPRRLRGGDPRDLRVVHEHGGQVYMDGANMNAQVGLTAPATSAPTSAT
jgi:glycine dehydrogenase